MHTEYSTNLFPHCTYRYICHGVLTYTIALIKIDEKGNDTRNLVRWFFYIYYKVYIINLRTTNIHLKIMFKYIIITQVDRKICKFKIDRIEFLYI